MKRRYTVLLWGVVLVHLSLFTSCGVVWVLWLTLIQRYFEGSLLVSLVSLHTWLWPFPSTVNVCPALIGCACASLISPSLSLWSAEFVSPFVPSSKPSSVSSLWLLLLLFFLTMLVYFGFCLVGMCSRPHSVGKVLELLCHHVKQPSASDAGVK